MLNKLPIPQAMAWKFPGAVCSKNETGDGIDAWNHPTILKPNSIEVARILEEYEDHMASVAYKEQRAREYPPIEEQLDAIWKGGDEMEAMRQIIIAVKYKYPKPKGE